MISKRNWLNLLLQIINASFFIVSVFKNTEKNFERLNYSAICYINFCTVDAKALRIHIYSAALLNSTVYTSRSDGERNPLCRRNTFVYKYFLSARAWIGTKGVDRKWNFSSIPIDETMMDGIFFFPLQNNIIPRKSFSNAEMRCSSDINF
jgi:hypothetical protein